MLAVNCKHDGCPTNRKIVEVIDFIFADSNEAKKQQNKPERPQSAHETSSSGWPDFLFSVASPKQKSQ